MFELKKHVKERLIKRTEGIISLLLIVLLVPFYSVAAILEEVGRYQSALRGLDSAISSSEMSVLAQYDQFLMDRFALLAIDQNKNIDQQFLSYLKKQDTQDTRSFSLSNAQTKATGVYPLADIEVLYQQINEFSTYTVPTKLILEGVNFDNIVSQLEGYSTTVSNVIKQLNSVGSSLQGGLDSYNAQKEASEQLDAVTKTTGEYAESYNRFKNAMDSLIEHKKTERPENEKEAAQWDEQLKNLLQEANTAKDDYQNQIDKERDGISSLAKKFDTAASKERSAYDTLVDGVTTAVSTKQASEKDVLNKNIQDNKGVIKEIDRQLAALGDDPQGENREEKRQLKALRDQVQERINEDTDSINKIANETTSMKEITDELKTGDNAKDVLEDYNSEACVDSLKGLNEEMEFLKGMDLETMNADSLENLAGKLHQVDLSKFSDTSSYKELWNNVRQSVGQESIQGVPMDFIDGIFALLSIDTLYDEDLNSKIDLNYYGKLPSQRIRSAQEYSLDSPFEKEDQKTAQDNLNKIGLPISEADSVELDGGINVGGQADDDGEATGNLFKKMIQMVNRLKKKMEGYKAVVDSMSNLAKGNSWDKVLLMGYLTYSVSNRTNYDSGVSLSGASFSGSGGLAPKYEAQNVRGEFLVKEENKYSFCGAEMEYLMTGKMSEYVWNYADENGDVTKMQLTVQAGSRQMNAIVNYPSNLDAEAIAGIIAGYTLKKEYPEIEEAYLEFQKAAEANSRLAERIDVNHVTEAQMQEAEALAAQWEALESKYGSYFQIYENEIQKWAGVDWRPQIIETVFLSNPVSRVEKTSDTLYIYVPTGTRYTKAIMDFISYSGKSESIDATDMVMKGKKNNLSQPIYEWDMSSNMIGSFKIEYREDK